MISEFLYNPIAPNAAELAAGFTDKDDFEFIQIRNIINEELELVWNDSRSPEAALNSAADRSNLKLREFEKTYK